jgi:hypothetical protein
MEGMFTYSTMPGSSPDADMKNVVAQIVREKKRLRVCSLAETFDCHLLWAHYASGFSGMAIEVELPDDSPAIRKVSYGGVFAGLMLDGGINPQEAAEDILGSKYSEWSYEREIRVLHPQSYFQLNVPVRHVIAGHRMEPALFDALNFICHKKGIRFSRTGIGDEGIDADYVEPPLEESFATTDSISKASKPAKKSK